MNSSIERSTSSVQSSSKISYSESNRSETVFKELTQIDIEIRIQTERITSIFNELIYKTEIAIFTLHMDNNDLDSMAKIVSERDLYSIQKFHAKPFTPKMKKSTQYEIITEEDIQKYIMNPGPKIYPELSQIIWIIVKYPTLRIIIENKIQQVRHSLSNIFWYGFNYIHNSMSYIYFHMCKQLRIENNKLQNNGSQLEVILYLDAFIKLKSKLIERMTMTAAEKLKRDMIQRNLNTLNKALNLRITDITNKIKEEKETFETMFKEKEDIIKKQQELLDYLKRDCENMILKKILETENEMELEMNCHILRKEILVQKHNESKEHYDCLLREHLDNENDLRAERIKAENQLLELLKEYDDVVGSKQANLDHLTKCYEEEKRQFEELQIKFDEQEAIYIPLMAEKEAEYQREVLNKMTTFLMEHAARVIQRAWRQILAARAEKKKQKRGAGKKKKIKDGSVGATQA